MLSPCTPSSGCPLMFRARILGFLYTWYVWTHFKLRGKKNSKYNNNKNNTKMPVLGYLRGKMVSLLIIIRRIKDINTCMKIDAIKDLKRHINEQHSATRKPWFPTLQRLGFRLALYPGRLAAQWSSAIDYRSFESREDEEHHVFT